MRQNSDGSFTPFAADKEVDYYPVDITKSNGTAKEVDVNEYYYYDKDGNMTQEEIDWERRVEVTAETLVALLEVGVENQVDADVAKKSQSYLEHNLHNLTSPAALAATVLALVLARYIQCHDITFISRFLLNLIVCFQYDAAAFIVIVTHTIHVCNINHN